MNIDNAVVPSPVTTGGHSVARKDPAGGEFADTFRQQVKLSDAANRQHSAPSREAAKAAGQSSPRTQPADEAGQEQESASEKSSLAGDTDNAFEAIAAWSGAFKPGKASGGQADDGQSGNDALFSNGLPFVAAQMAAQDVTKAAVTEPSLLAAGKPTVFDTTVTVSAPLQPVGETTITDGLSVTGPESFAAGLQSLRHEAGSGESARTMLAIDKPINHPGWGKDLGEHIVWMSNKTLSSADITLNPEHLGPVTVRIDLDQDQASVLFTTPHAAVKEALDASIPKLREMLGSQHINLVDVNVSQQSASDNPHTPARHQNGQMASDGESADVTAEQSPTARTLDVNGLVSLYV